MRDTEESITEIWQKTGFTSAQYFSYVFKRKEGVLPNEVQKKSEEWMKVWAEERRKKQENYR